MEWIEKHGGTIRLLEKDADIMLVDHTRKNLPSNTYSYQYVERSVQNGRLEPLEAYRAGPSAHRPVGATHIPTRGRRVQFTLEDDQILWDWMQPYERDPGAPVHGYTIYKKLAEKTLTIVIAQHPKHTFQSWRDRAKKLRGRPRPGGMPAGQTTTPGEGSDRRSPAHQPSTSNTSQGPHTHKEAGPSSVPEPRKRKRSPVDEPSGRPAPRRPEESSREVRIGTSQEASSSKSRQPQPERTERRPQPPTSTKDITSNPPTTRTKESAQSHAARDPVDKTQSAVDSLFLELPFPPSSPEPEEESADLDEWIDARLSIGSTEQVLEALRCTSMNPSLADNVLRSIVSGKGIPSNMPGVWTPEDDKCIEGNDARSIGRLLDKHGTFFNIRWEYLSLARAAGTET
ncbi:transcription factor Rap1 [Aspergillus sp. HF37]|nr:transcription factor Rap1 [Aspergillus sp. HF37]